MSIRDDLAEQYGEDLLFMDTFGGDDSEKGGFDDCIVGVVERFGTEPVICYDRGAVIAKLVSDGLIEELAEEWYSYNMIGSWMGDKTPCFLRTR